MSEVFKEYLIKQKKSQVDLAMQIGLVVGAVVLSVASFLMGGDFIGPILIVGILFGTVYLFNRFSREYEYILTNNELDIDVIYNRTSRKRVITFDMKKIDIMASIKDDRHTAELNRGNFKVINASDNTNEANTYAIIAQSEKYGACKILITPNDALLEDLYRQAPNKVFKKR